MPHPPHIVICGGGIGGLSAALTLMRGGARVTVLERSQSAGEYGAGLQLSPNAMHVLRALGVAKAIEADSFEPEAGIFRDYKSGAPLLTTPMKGPYSARYGEKYLHIHRADLHAALLNAVKHAGVDIQTGVVVTGYEQDELGIRAITLKGDVEGDILIGADGIKSIVRDQMHGESTPEFTGQIAWRGLVETSTLPANTLPRAANNWMGPGRHFVSYYMRSGALINFVAVLETEQWANEDWRQDGDMEALRAAFSDFDPRVKAILDACQASQLWGLFDRPPTPEWTDGRAALLGDAAHPMLPFMAQGAAMAIEDSWVLAHMIFTHDDPITALKAYQAARNERANFVQRLSRNNAKLYHLSSPAQKAWRAAKFKIATNFPAAAHSRLDPVFGVNVTQTFPRERYPHDLSHSNERRLLDGAWRPRKP